MKQAAAQTGRGQQAAKPAPLALTHAGAPRTRGTSAVIVPAESFQKGDTASACGPWALSPFPGRSESGTVQTLGLRWQVRSPARREPAGGQAGPSRPAPRPPPPLPHPPPLSCLPLLPQRELDGCLSELGLLSSQPEGAVREGLEGSQPVYMRMAGEWGDPRCLLLPVPPLHLLLLLHLSLCPPSLWFKETFCAVHRLASAWSSTQHTRAHTLPQGGPGSFHAPFLCHDSARAQLWK